MSLNSTGDGSSLTRLARLPGLESSKNNREEEDALYDEMMTALLQRVLRPLWRSGDRQTDEQDHWCQVRSSDGDPGDRGDEAPLWRNLFTWRAFTLKNRHRLTLSKAPG